MSRAEIDIDDDALAGAMKELGTTTPEETVNAALRDIAGREQRLALLGLLDNTDLGDEEVMRGARR